MSDAGDLEGLRREIALLREHVQLLALSKITDPRYAYWSLIVQDQIDEEQRGKIEAVLDYLNDRAEDPESVAGSRSAAETATGRQLPESGPVEKEEIDALVGSVYGSVGFDSSELLAAGAAQGRWLDLAEQVLPNFLVS